MANRPEIVERTPIQDVEVQFAHASSSKRSGKTRFSRGRLLDIEPERVEVGLREAFFPGERLALTLHTKTVRNFLKVDAEVQESTRVTILRQPAYAIELTYGKLNNDQKSKIAWASKELAPRQRTPTRIERPAIEAEEEDTPMPATPLPETATAVAEQPAPTPTPGLERDMSDSGIRRPVALLELIDKLDNLEVTDDLIWAVIEAAEADMDVEVLYPTRKPVVSSGAAPTVESFDEEEEAAPAPPAQARPINVYRLAPNTNLHFSKSGLPAGPAHGMIYVSQLAEPEQCFAVELGVDTMVQTLDPSFPEGSVLIFNIGASVENGDFAYMKLRGKDVFAQLFYSGDDEVRVRFLNHAYPEQAAKRREVRMLYRLVGFFRSM